jgi:hypothetical protein
MGDVVQQEKKSTTPHQFEEDHINLITIRYIKAVCSKSNERKFVIQCVMDEYEERAMLPFKQGIHNCSNMILMSLRQVRNW